MSNNYELAKHQLDIDSDNFLADTTVWDELTTETARLNSLLDSGQNLSPEDIKDVSNLAKKVKNYGVLYRREVTKVAKNYKEFLNEQLTSIGYDKIEQYVESRKLEASNARRDRQNRKVNKFNSLVNQELNNLTYLPKSSLRYSVVNALGSRFPKINSGAKNKEINDWKAIETVVTLTLSNIEKIMEKYPVIVKLPQISISIRNLTDYLKSGDENLITDDAIKLALKQDHDLILEIVVKNKYQTDKDVINGINDILGQKQNDHSKLTSIKRLIDLYYA